MTRQRTLAAVVFSIVAILSIAACGHKNEATAAVTAPAAAPAVPVAVAPVAPAPIPKPVAAPVIHDAGDDPSTPSAVRTMMSAEGELNDKCRGGPGDSPATTKACDDRDAIEAQIEKNGYCWGHAGDFGYQRKWVKCQDGDLSNSDTTPVAAASAPAKRIWWAVATEGDHCINISGPADAIGQFIGTGIKPTTQDFRDAQGNLVKVIVSAAANDLSESSWTFYSTQNQCMSEGANVVKNLADKYK